MTTPLFSIITVCLNPGDSLGRTIASIKSQRFRGLEHIIKDGGSIDGSLQRNVRADDRYQPFLMQKADQGIYDAMNQALDVARGRYVVFLNAGDYLYDDGALLALAEVIEREPNLGLIYGDYYAEKLNLAVKCPSRLTGFSLYRNTICHQACFVARELFEELGRFDLTLRVLADYDFLLRLAVSARVPRYYLSRTIVACMANGFSARAENVALALNESRALRRRYFHPAERVLFECIRVSTLPQLRIWLMRSKSLVRLQRIYAHLANLWNR